MYYGCDDKGMTEFTLKNYASTEFDEKMNGTYETVFVDFLRKAGNLNVEKEDKNYFKSSRINSKFEKQNVFFLFFSLLLNDDI